MVVVMCTRASRSWMAIYIHCWQRVLGGGESSWWSNRDLSCCWLMVDTPPPPQTHLPTHLSDWYTTTTHTCTSEQSWPLQCAHSGLWLSPLGPVCPGRVFLFLYMYICMTWPLLCICMYVYQSINQLDQWGWVGEYKNKRSQSWTQQQQQLLLLLLPPMLLENMRRLLACLLARYRKLVGMVRLFQETQTWD